MQLYEKFRNERKRSNNPEALLRRAKKQKCDNKEETTEERNRRDGIEYEPLFLEGEDEESMKKHKRFIKAEWKKRTPDMKKINERMELTYPNKRKRIPTTVQLRSGKETCIFT